MDRAELVRQKRARERERKLNQTWRNPRYYVVFLVLPLALALAAIPWAFELAGKGAAAASEWLNDALRWFWGPLERWIMRGARKSAP